MVKWYELVLFLFGAGIGWIIGFIQGWNISLNNLGILIEKRERVRGSRREGEGSSTRH